MSRKDSVSSNDHWIIHNRRNGSLIPLSRELVFVGKSDCDIVLDSSSVDNRHAVISFSPREGLFYVKDLNTSHGTFVNDWKIPVQTYIKLEHLNKLRFGFSSDVFTICKSESRPPTARTPTSSEAPAAPSNPPGVVIQPKVLQPQPLLDPSQESPAVLRMKYAKKHHSSNIFPLPFCADDYKPPPKPLVEEKKPVSTVEPAETAVSMSVPPPDVLRGCPESPIPCSKSQAAPVELDRPIKALSAMIVKSKKSFQEELAVPKVPPAPPTAFTISFDEGPKKCAPPKLSSMDRPPKSEPRKDFEGGKTLAHDTKTSPISDSAAYLINRMFQSQKFQEDSESDRGQSPISESERGLDSGVCDDRSECGTYTLQSEKKDADVERARKMIDDVFGVSDYVKKNKISPDSSPECSTPSNSIVRNPSPVDSDSVDKQKTFSRRKGGENSEDRENQRGRPRSKVSNQMTMSAIESSTSSPVLRRKFDSPSRSASSSRTVELKRDPRLSPLASRKESYTRSKSNLSVASNESEPTSTNYRSDSTLKLNRAFALRRARLGIETPGVPLNLSSEKPPKAPSHLNRFDGGRFSLRAGRGSVGSLCSATSSRKSVKEENRRSAPGPPRAKTCSDTERAYRSLHENVNKSLANKSKQVSDVEYGQSRGSLPGNRAAFGGRGLQALSCPRNKQQANVAPIKRQETEQMSSSMIETRSPEAISRAPKSSQRIMSALDNLVLAAVMQLSSKLKRGMCEFLEKEQRKYPRGSDTRMMIEEILPQVGADDTRLPDNSSESPSKELSNILKNLKKVEQSLEVLTLLADIEPAQTTQSRCFDLEV